METKIPVTQEFELEVNGNQSLEAMIEAGKYDWEMTGGTEPSQENQPRIADKSKRLVPISLIPFNRIISSSEVREGMEKRSLRPAAIEEILAIGEHHPYLQQLFPIIGLGAGPKDFEALLFFAEGLGRGVVIRGRAVYFWVIRNGVWLPKCHFAAVPK